ncbi:hypothetical protein HPB50_023105 [Hyalomma asiaticum]|uniref:Uncharacterized protein n=1 Tax=Hyalomma asiaticum TaxID=266040 RepID=A0ACB7TM90_HYAAI|nr:hypothetical protein HPB50_023105 [Hyalomma asiaticum]
MREQRDSQQYRSSASSRIAAAASLTRKARCRAVLRRDGQKRPPPHVHFMAPTQNQSGRDGSNDQVSAGRASHGRWRGKCASSPNLSPVSRSVMGQHPYVAAAVAQLVTMLGVNTMGHVIAVQENLQPLPRPLIADGPLTSFPEDA